MPPKKGPGVDQADVERAKALAAIGTPRKQIAAQIGASMATVQRYIRRPDETPEQEEARIRQLIRHIESIHEVLLLAEAKVIDSLKNNEIKGKDAAVIWAIHLDKLLMLEAKVAPTEQTTKTFTLKVISDGSDSKSLPSPGEVPQLESAVPLDDRGSGFGENLLGLPGGRDPEFGAEDLGGGGSLDVQGA